MNASETFDSWESAVLWLRQQPDQQNLVRAAYYDEPLTAASERYRKSAEWQAIREWLPAAPGTALDVGAGRGIASYALALEGFTVTALEPNPSKIVGAGAIRALACETGIGIEIIEEACEQLPFLDSSFDLVFARAVLHHATDLSEACKEFYRVLKPGGLLIAVREHVISRPEDLREFLRSHPLHHLYGGENALLLAEYSGALRKARFTVRSIVGPLESAVNYSPQTRQSLREELVTRVAGASFMRHLLRAALGIPGAFSMALHVVSLVDSRPGRLYSFVCSK